MADWHAPEGPFDIPDVRDFVPRKLKPWLYILFVIVIQFSGGLYMAAASDMVGTTGLMQQDILMAGYSQLVGMAVNFAVMFRLKFAFSNRTGLLICGAALVGANLICAHTDNVWLLTAACFAAGWFRMWATLVCNSTIQLWLTPTRDMAVFFCYVYLLVDGVIQISGITAIYTAFFSHWVNMHWLITGSLLAMMALVVIFLKPLRGMPRIPLKGIDWTGGLIWGGFMHCFTFICVYGNHYDWWEGEEIRWATLIGIACMAANLWRATFLQHPYITFQAMRNRNVIRATLVYLIFFTVMATEHVFEHSYASAILGFDETNIIDLNWYVMAGILAGTALTYFSFALRRWSYKTMTVIGFILAALYLGWFYFTLDYGVEKEALFIPLFTRGAASVIISIVFLTSIVQGGLPFEVFPQALTINGFTGAVMGAALGPAVIGEWFAHTFAKNASLISSALTDFNPSVSRIPAGQLYGEVALQAMAVSMKEIYGWLLIATMATLLVILVSYGPVRPAASFPKWRSIRKLFRRQAMAASR